MAQGVWKFYHENGQLKIKGLYVDGKEDGHWVQFYDNGQVKLDLYYKMGKLEGLLTAYDEEGKILEQAEFADNKMVRKIK